MASLHVRQLEPEIVEALKERARRNHRSAEAEHRAILKEVLLTSSIAKQLLKKKVRQGLKNVAVLDTRLFD